MKFNLNDNSLVGGGSKVFNNGIAGKVENVKIDVEKRKSSDPDNQPDYKLLVTDGNDLTLNQGFYYHKDNEMNSEEKNEANKGYLVGRILSAAKAVVPEGFVFPDVEGKDVNEIVDILFRIIKENADGKLVNVFATYGTKTKASTFLGLRYFNFIEAVGTPKSRLVATGNDMMERITEDAPAASGAPAKADW
jgi:hypothetical protein